MSTRPASAERLSSLSHAAEGRGGAAAASDTVRAERVSATRIEIRLTRRRFRPVQRIDGDDADRARHAGADLAVVVLLLVAEEHVAMVDLALDGNDVDGADAAFAALAVRCHISVPPPCSPRPVMVRAKIELFKYCSSQ